MLNSKEYDRSRRASIEDRRASIKQWAAYVRSHDDDVWSRQQNELIDSQLQSANELARSGDTDPITFIRARESLGAEEPNE